MVEAISEPYTVGDAAVDIGASIGIACDRDGRADADELMHLADDAMYAAKCAGKNRYSLAAASSQ
jgi:diguanylate cyclase (GGDEF)-like protein